MRHIIAGVATLLAIWATVYMVNLDVGVNKLDKISKLIDKTRMEDSKLKVKNQDNTKQTSQIETPKAKQEDEMDKKLKALREKAGNIAAFEVSPLYKKSCASCHGNIGEGIIGPKLLGQSKDKVFQALKNFKTGKRKNYVMYGLLGSLSEAELEELSSEIATFKEKLEKASK